MHKDQKGFSILEVVTVLAVLVLVGFIGFTAYKKVAPKISKSNGLSQECKTNPVRFTHHLTETEKIHQILPMGTPGKPSRTYIHQNKEFVEAGGKVPIYAPTDVSLTSLAYYVHPVDKHILWALDFEAGCGIDVTIGHVTEVVDRIKQAGPKEPAFQNSRTSPPKSKLSFKAGEQIGWTTEQSWDFVVSDKNHINKFVNQARYTKTTDYLHGICPYDLFTAELKSTYEAKYGFFGRHFDGATCGKVSSDEAGTLSGQWFGKQAVGKNFEDNQLGISFRSFASSKDEFLVEIAEEISTSAQILSSQVTYKDPKTVKDSHCYQSDKGDYFYAKLVGENELQVAKGKGNCPPTFPNTTLKTYYR